MPWLTILLFTVLTFFVVNSISGIYVRYKYGADMIGSHLHGWIAERWMWRLIKVVFFVFLFFFVCFTLVLFQGQWDTVFSGFWTFFKLIFWDLPSTIVGGAFKSIF